MNKSDSIKNLSESLAKFQGEISNPSNSKTVSAGQFSYKYAPLDEVLSLVRPLLSKHGLSIVQSPLMTDGMVGVSTALLHQSGEYLEFAPIMLRMDKQSAQGAGSAITYARRYALSAILGISSQDDDDANSREPNRIDTKKQSKPKQQNTSVDPDKKAIEDNSLCTEAQLNLIDRIMKNKNFTTESIASFIEMNYKKKDLKALTKQEASDLISHLNSTGK